MLLNHCKIVPAVGIAMLALTSIGTPSQAGTSASVGPAGQEARQGHSDTAADVLHMLNETNKLTASETAVDDLFGGAVAISGDIAAVGVTFDDDLGNKSGSVYVFARSQGGTDNWGEVKKLTASDPAADDEFGGAVSIDGDTLVVSARLNDDAGLNSGSAYVFHRNRGGTDNWGQVKKITASDGASVDIFGASVAVAGDTLVVGAFGDDDAGSSSGSAYVFDRDLGGLDNWGQRAKLTAGDAAAGDEFGDSVAISGDTVVVGAPGDADAGTNTGSAYVFDRDNGGANSWGQVKKLVASDQEAFDLFGFSVSISGDTVVAGAYGDDDIGPTSGSVYVFERDHGGANNWGQFKKLTASDGLHSDWFGYSVAISGDAVVVAARNSDGAGSESGSAYMIDRNQGGADNWGEGAKLTASDAAASDRFGHSVAISGDTVVVGAYLDDNPADDTGSAYVFGPPGQADLVTPSGPISDNTPTYTWNKLPGSTWYYLWINDANGNIFKQWYKAVDVCTGGTCSFTPKFTLGNSYHAWWIQGWNWLGYGAWNQGLTFTPAGATPTPGPASLTSPMGTVDTSTPTYTWEAVLADQHADVAADAATWYHLWVNGPAGNLINEWYQAGTVCSGTSCSVAPATTLSNGDHVFWVRTNNSGGDGPWSAPMHFTVASVAGLPGEAVLLSPSGPTTDSTPTFTWTATLNDAADATTPDAATWYYLWVNDPSGNIFDQWYQSSTICSGQTCSVTPAATLSSDDYTWWVQTWNAAGDGPWSDPLKFLVMAADRR